MLPCILNGQAEAHDRIQSREELGEIDYITADYERVKLLEGLQEARIEESFLTLAKPLKRIAETVPKTCIAVGDGATDIPVFEYCGKSIAINSSEKVKRVATHAVDTDDLFDIVALI